MNTIIILAMHGIPPNDFPREKLSDFYSLYSRFRHGTGGPQSPAMERYTTLSREIKYWPRTASNDPFYTASQKMAEDLNREIGKEVIVGYNEFCAPDMNEAMDEAVSRKAEKVVVVTPMMTRGGEHAETEIPNLVKNFQNLHPEIEIVYAWPFGPKEIARFLAQQISRFV